MKIRAGYGFDVHQLTEGRKLVLGGVHFPHSKGALGHSDADVLLHAICDALLGAAGLRDIGFYFPNTDKTFENIDSKILLEKVHNLIQEKGYSIGNIDATLVLEKPKINPKVEQIKDAISKILQIEIDDIAIKATT